MRTTCIGCPALEDKNGKPFCYYYQSSVDTNKPCGNTFNEKPEFTQEESEVICFQLSSKHLTIPTEEMDKYFKETKEWPERFDDDIEQAIRKAEEEMRQTKRRNNAIK